MRILIKFMVSLVFWLCYVYGGGICCFVGFVFVCLLCVVFIVGLCCCVFVCSVVCL